MGYWHNKNSLNSNNYINQSILCNNKQKSIPATAEDYELIAKSAKLIIDSRHKFKKTKNVYYA